MKALALGYLGLVAAYCGFMSVQCWRTARRIGRASDLLAYRAAPGRVNPSWLFMTPHGTELGVHVFASCDQEAAEILAIADAFKPARVT